MAARGLVRWHRLPALATPVCRRTIRAGPPGRDRRAIDRRRRGAEAPLARVEPSNRGAECERTAGDRGDDLVRQPPSSNSDSTNRRSLGASASAASSAGVAQSSAVCSWQMGSPSISAGTKAMR